jgi:isopenicillin N synthase-like dioxygenase
MSIPILDLGSNPVNNPTLLKELHNAAFDVGFLYIKNHGVDASIIQELVSRLPPLFGLSEGRKLSLSKLNSPHFLGYNGYAEETTLGEKDLREQFDFATELPVIWIDKEVKDPTLYFEHDHTDPYWQLRGPNQWPDEHDIPGFRRALTRYELNELLIRRSSCSQRGDTMMRFQTYPEDLFT